MKYLSRVILVSLGIIVAIKILVFATAQHAQYKVAPQTTTTKASQNSPEPSKSQPTRILNCITLDAAHHDYTPVELFTAAASCAKDHRYKDSSALYALADAYGHFDKARVANPSTHQVITSLIIKIFSPATVENENDIKPFFSALSQPDSPDMREICKNLRAIGAPTYTPDYMLNYNNQALNNGLVSNFDREKVWTDTLTNYLHCAP